MVVDAAGGGIVDAAASGGIVDESTTSPVIVALIEAQTATLLAVIAAVQATVDEVDQHDHNIERWWGTTGADTETNAILATVTAPYSAVSGNDDWGTAIPICGTADNPVLATMDEFDAHRVLVVGLDDQTDAWRFRILWGTGTSGEAETAEQWSEIMLQSNAVPGNRAGGTAFAVRMPPVDVGYKMWAQSWNDSLDEVLQFFWGAHGYPYPH